MYFSCLLNNVSLSHILISMFFFSTWMSLSTNDNAKRSKLAPHYCFMVLKKFLLILWLCYKSSHLFCYDFYFYCHALKVTFPNSINESPPSFPASLSEKPLTIAFPAPFTPIRVQSKYLSVGLILLFLQPSSLSFPKSYDILEQAKPLLLQDPAPQSTVTWSTPGSLHACKNTRF